MFILKLLTTLKSLTIVTLEIQISFSLHIPSNDEKCIDKAPNYFIVFLIHVE